MCPKTWAICTHDLTMQIEDTTLWFLFFVVLCLIKSHVILLSLFEPLIWPGNYEASQKLKIGVSALLEVTQKIHMIRSDRRIANVYGIAKIPADSISVLICCTRSPHNLGLN